MDPSIPLSTIIFGELAFALLVFLVFLVHHLIRQRKIIAKLMEKIASHAKAAATNDFYTENASPDRQTISDFFEQSLRDSLQRFQRFSPGAEPRINNKSPFSAKIAALRYIYLCAEKELFSERGITHSGWGNLERRLEEIIKPDEQSSERYKSIVKDLQQKLKNSGHEISRQKAKNSYLLKRMETIRSEQKSLEHLNTKNSALIEHLQDALNKLKDSTVGALVNKNNSSYSALDDLYIESFGKANTIESHNLRALFHEIRNSQPAVNPAQQKKIEDQVNLLEIELLKSDRHIDDLKKQLKDAKRQITNYAIIKNEKRFAGDIDSLYQNIIRKVSPGAEEDPDTIMAEISNLRASNQIKYDTINSLENEISNIQDSITNDITDTSNEAKRKETQRLERLVKECQDCILILEEEVDSLYARLQEQASLLELPAEDENTEEQETPPSFAEVDLIMEELEKTARNYQHIYAINTILLDLFRCHDFDALVSQLLHFIDSFKLPASFYIHCSAGEKEHFPQETLNEEKKSLLFAHETEENIVRRDDATLFVYPNIRALIPSSEAEATSILDTNFTVIIAAVNERLNDLSQHTTEEKNAEKDIETTRQIKDSLNNLNIKYAFQVDENRKTFDHFLAELRRAYSQLDLRGPGGIVLDNAINEFEIRMSLLLETSDAIDEEIASLVEKMEREHLT